MSALPTALAALAHYRQFILFRRADKVPCSPVTGAPCDPHDPTNWTDSATAHATADANTAYGVGFVLTERDPFFCLDIDGALRADNTWSPDALAICAMFPGAAIEVSQSGRGLHIWGKYSDVPPHGCKNTALGLELYTERRYIALGQPNATGDANTDHTAILPFVISSYFPPTSSDPAVSPIDWVDAPVPEWRGPANDDELIRRMLSSKMSTRAAFGNTATPAELWAADPAILSKYYPSSSGQAYDGSSVDQALANHLSWWTGKNPVRIERLMRMSALVREKWDRDDYLRVRTIPKAIAQCKSVLQDKPIDMPPASTTTDAPADTDESAPATSQARVITGGTFLTSSDQEGLFKNHVYVRSANKILIPGGELLDQPRFDVTYGRFTFSLDATNEKTAKGAWDAFTHSKVIDFPKVQCTCFRPELPPGAVITEADRSMVNTYWPIKTEAKAGDVTPFTTHLTKLLPDATDRAALIAYLAALVQYPGDKFQWAPLIQGVEGNGKSLILSCLESAIGDRYAHRPNASDIGGNGGKFTGWMQNKLLIGIEEIKSSHRSELLEIMKPWITNSRLEIQAKGADQVTGDNRANFILFSNHRDAITKTARDRRYAIFYTAQQEPEDLRRDGMDGDYFPKLYTWLRDGGYAAVTHFLRTYAIPAALNPALTNGGLATRAPRTTSTDEAVTLSLGRVEQEVIEAIAQRRHGFAGGWIASTELDDLLRERKLDGAVARNKRAAMLAGIGYVHHPGLEGGRATSPVAGGARPILYVKTGHLSSQITGGSAICRAYDAAQLHARTGIGAGEGVAA